MRRLKDTGSGTPTDVVPTELIERCKSGDQQAWAELVAATHRDVYTLCLRILGDPDDAAEATQDAFLKVWRSLGTFRGDSMFTTWLYRVTTNTAISRLRSRTRRRSHETGAEDEVLGQLSAAESTESTAATRFALDDLEGALALLPEHYRAAVVLRDVYGFGIAEIAKRLHISETAAKVRVHRGRRRLRELVFVDEPEG
jgi:RNA polymerase sigma-70 factor (ECF subfamily)